MARILADRIRETSTTTGTGNIVLLGAAAGGFGTFGSVMNEGDTAPVTILGEAAGQFEVREVSFNADGELVRDGQIYRSSNELSPGVFGTVDFGPGIKQVFLTITAADARTEAETRRVQNQARDLEKDCGIVDNELSALNTLRFELALNSGHALTFPRKLFRVRLTRDVVCNTPGTTLQCFGRLSQIIVEPYPSAGIRFEQANECKILGFPIFINENPQALITADSAAATGHTSYRGDSLVTSAHAIMRSGCSYCHFEIETRNFPTALRVRPYNRASEWSYNNYTHAIMDTHCFGVLGAGEWDSTFILEGRNSLPQTRPGDINLPPHSCGYWAGGVNLGEGGGEDDFNNDENLGDFGISSDTPSVNCKFTIKADKDFSSSHAKFQGLFGGHVDIIGNSGARGLEFGRCQGTTFNATLQPVRAKKYYYDGSPPTTATEGADPYASAVNIALSKGVRGTVTATLPNGERGIAIVNIRRGSQGCHVEVGLASVSPTTAAIREYFRIVDGCEDCSITVRKIKNSGAASKLGLISGSPNSKIFFDDIEQPDTSSVAVVEISASSPGAVVSIPGTAWRGPTAPIISDAGPSSRIFLPGITPSYTVANLPPARARPDRMARLTDGSSPGALIYSDGVDWFFTTTGAVVPTIAASVQPDTKAAGATNSMRVTATNLASVAFTLYNAAHAVVAGPTLVAVSGGSATYNFFTPITVATGYYIVAANPVGGAATVTSSAFASLTPPAFSWVPSDLGADLIAAFDVNVDASRPAGELQHLYDSAKKVTAFGTGNPSIVTGVGVTADRDRMDFASNAMRTQGNFAALKAALDGSISGRAKTFALAFEGGASGNRTICGWGGSGVGSVQLRTSSSLLQLLLSGSGGSPHAITIAAQSGGPHVVQVRIDSGNVKIWYDAFDHTAPTVDTTISGPTGTQTADDFWFSAVIAGSNAWTPHTDGAKLYALVVSNVAEPVADDGDLNHMMQWAGYQAGITVS